MKVLKESDKIVYKVEFDISKVKYIKIILRMMYLGLYIKIKKWEKHSRENDKYALNDGVALKVNRGNRKISEFEQEIYKKSN